MRSMASDFREPDGMRSDSVRRDRAIAMKVGGNPGSVPSGLGAKASKAGGRRPWRRHGSSSVTEWRRALKARDAAISAAIVPQRAIVLGSGVSMPSGVMRKATHWPL